MNIQTNLEILHKAYKGPILNILQQFEIYKHQKAQKNEILNDQIAYDDLIWYDVITQQETPSPPHPAF